MRRPQPGRPLTCDERDRAQSVRLPMLQSSLQPRQIQTAPALRAQAGWERPAVVSGQARPEIVWEHTPAPAYEPPRSVASWRKRVQRTERVRLDGAPSL